MPQGSAKKSSSFAIDVAKMATGTTFAQVVTILVSPILTRLYGPEAFGISALFGSITGIIGIIVCLRYNFAIILPDNEKEAVNIMGLSLLIALITSGLSAVALFFGGDELLSLLNAPGLAPYLILMPPFIFIGGIFLALNSWNTRTKHFGRLSIARITNSIVTTSVNLGAGFAGFTTGGSLIGATFLGSAASTGVLGVQIWRDDRQTFTSNFSLQYVLAGLKKYKKFPLYDSGSALLNNISWQLPALLFSAFFSPAIVGFYALGWRLLQMPMSLVGTAISQVFFQRAAELEHGDALAPFAERVFEALLVIGLFPMLILTVVGEELFTVIFGQVWAEAGVYVQILSVWAIFWFISSPLSTIYLVKEKLEFGLTFNIIIFLTRLASLVVGGLLASPIIALLLFAGSGILVYGYLCFFILKLCGVNYAWTGKKVISVARRFIPAGIVLVSLKIFGASAVILSIVASIVTITYFIYIIKTNSFIRSVIPGKVKQYI